MKEETRKRREEEKMSKQSKEREYQRQQFRKHFFQDGTPRRINESEETRRVREKGNQLHMNNRLEEINIAVEAMGEEIENYENEISVRKREIFDLSNEKTEIEKKINRTKTINRNRPLGRGGHWIVAGPV